MAIDNEGLRGVRLGGAEGVAAYAVTIGRAGAQSLANVPCGAYARGAAVGSDAVGVSSPRVQSVVIRPVFSGQRVGHSESSAASALTTRPKGHGIAGVVVTSVAPAPVDSVVSSVRGVGSLLHALAPVWWSCPLRLPTSRDAVLRRIWGVFKSLDTPSQVGETGSVPEVEAGHIRAD